MSKGRLGRVPLIFFHKLANFVKIQDFAGLEMIRNNIYGSECACFRDLP